MTTFQAPEYEENDQEEDHVRPAARLREAAGQGRYRDPEPGCARSSSTERARLAQRQRRLWSGLTD